MMKKRLVAVLAIAMTLSLAACGSSASSSSGSSTDDSASSSVADGADSSSDAAAVGEGTAETSDDADVMTYADYLAADVDSAVVVDTYVQATQSWWDDTASLYTQDQDGAYFVYDAACSEDDYALLTPGTKIRVSGYKSEWSGEVEIIDATFEILDDGDAYVASPTDVTDLLSDDALIDYQNQMVSFSGMTVEPSTDADGNEAAFLYNWDGSGEAGSNCDLYFNVSKDGVTYNFTVESNLCDESTDVYQAVTELSIGDVIDMEGFLYWYNGVNPHITSVTAAN